MSLLASHTEEMFYTILDNLREAVNVVDTKGYITYVNPSSANYASARVEDMIGKHITEYYPHAALLDVIRDKKPLLDQKMAQGNGRTFIVNAVPLYRQGEFYGGVSTFRDITELDELARTLEYLENELTLSQGSGIFDSFIGADGSLRNAIFKAQRSIASVGGPRHSVILGETGTGKTMLAQGMYHFARKIGILKEGAPFVEVNCAQFTNADIAAMEIFGTDKGAFTGAFDKPGLVEVANGGVLFLDEAHALVQHQTMLLKLIESGLVRRMGGRTEHEVDVIIIAASSQNLKEVFLPELYQRLAQYQIELPPLRERSFQEKQQFLEQFVELYCQKAQARYNVRLKVHFTSSAAELLLAAGFDRNVRQFRDVVNASIDAVAPMVNHLSQGHELIKLVVDEDDIPMAMLEAKSVMKEASASVAKQESLEELLLSLSALGLGVRKISAELKRRGISLAYYQVAYKLKKLKKDRE